jgi:hypothetical protein
MRSPEFDCPASPSRERWQSKDCARVGGVNMESREVLREGVQAQTDVDQDNGRHPAPGHRAENARINQFAPDDGRRVTLEEYWAKWYENPYPDIDVSYEWNNGVLEAKPLANKPQLDLGNWFLDLLRRYLETHEIAELINMETGFFMTMVDSEEPSATRRAVRKPDIGIILHSNPVSWGRIDQRSFAGVCDAVVEFLSDSTQIEVRRDTEEKKRDYALAGVKEYTILDPSDEHMRFYRLTPQARYEEIQPDAEEVLYSEVLPGFQFRMEDLWQQPELAELALDEVYSGYVIPVLKVAVTRAEEAEAQVAAEAQRAAAEAQRADAEAAARQQAVERVQELEAELARLRQQRS